MITLNTEQAEVLRNIIDQNMQSDETGISQYTSNLTGDEDWVDYLEGDEGSILNAVSTATSAAGLARTLTQKIAEKGLKKAAEKVVAGGADDAAAAVAGGADDAAAAVAGGADDVTQAAASAQSSSPSSRTIEYFFKNNGEGIKSANKNNFTNIGKNKEVFNTLRNGLNDGQKETLTKALKTKPGKRDYNQKEIIKKFNELLKNEKSPLKLESRFNKNKKLLNEVVFLIPFVLKIVGQAIFWAAMYHFFDKHLRTEDSNWIEHRKLYVFDIDEEIYQEVSDHIDYLEDVLKVGSNEAAASEKEQDEQDEGGYQVSAEFKTAMKKLNSESELKSLFNALSKFVLPDFSKGYVQFAGALQNKDSLKMLKGKKFGFINASDEQLTQIAAIFKEIFIGASPNSGSVLEDALNELNIDDLVENETVDFTNLNIQNLGKFGKQINQKITLKNLLLSRFKKLQQKA